MFSRANIIIVFIIVFMPKSLTGVMHPTSTMEDSMTCDEFTKASRFNPYSIIGDVWMLFYYWAPVTSYTEFLFFYPGPKQKEFAKKLLADEHVTIPVNWTARVVLMRNIARNEHSLLVEKGDRGQFWLYPYFKRSKKDPKIEPIDARFKQTGDNKYVGFMICQREQVYVLTRLNNVPRQAKLQDAAARIGYRGRGGKSYLYQGHNWGPVDEMSEFEFWFPEKYDEQLRQNLKNSNAHLKNKYKNKKLKASKDKDDGNVEKNVFS